MEICPVTKLPITEKSHWNIAHPKGGYTTKFSLIGTDIIYFAHLSSQDITLDYICAEVFQSLLKELNLLQKPVYLVSNLEHIVNVEYAYKKDFTNFIFNWGPNIKLLAMFNIRPEVETLTETLASLSPQHSPILLTGTYEDAMNIVMSAKSGALDHTAYKPEVLDWNEFLKKEFLSSLARMTWLNMLDQHIYLPPEEDSSYPFFKAIEHLQQDMKAKESEHDREKQQIIQDFENRITQKIITLNAQVELNKKAAKLFEQDKSAMMSRISAMEMELTRISTAIAEKTSALHSLCNDIYQLDIPPAKKHRLSELCLDMIETEKTEKRLNTELTIADSEFLSRLQKKHPNLNQRDLRISLMVKLDYDTKEIARSIGISTRGMESIRYRMHKKLGLDKHKSIKTYLTELTHNQLE
jgi:DNA-binding CsgD family transcriptional regulator